MLLIISAKVCAQDINVKKKVGLYMLESKIGKDNFKYCNISPKDTILFDMLSEDNVCVKFKNYTGWIKLSDLNESSKSIAKAKSSNKQQASANVIRCKATTQKGSQCKRNCANGSSYCWQHEQINSKKTSITQSNISNKAEKQTNNQTSYRCKATTKKGAQCKRSASAGSSYCWQHQ